MNALEAVGRGPTGRWCGGRQDDDDDHVVALPNDPLTSIARLRDAIVDDEHVVYENAGTWRVAVGVLAELWLDDEGGHLRSSALCRDVPWVDDPFAQVQSLLAALPYRRWCAYGWASFELAYARHPDLERAGAERLLHLIVPRTEVVLDARGARIRAEDPATAAVLEAALRRTATRRPNASRVPVDVDTAHAREYQEAVERAVEAIGRGQLDKVVLSRTVPVRTDLDFVDTYVTGRRAHDPARSFLLSLAGVEALGFSPETIVRVESSGAVRSQPVAGTRAHTSDPTENARLGQDLCSDPKEVFEHAISIKTLQHELAGVCVRDTVTVTDFMSVRERGSAQHLASELTGRLAADRRAWDAFCAVFPAVTASGIPKPAAYAQIRALEREARGLYAGAVLTLDHEGTLDAALVLRALYRQHGETWLRAGGGIVAHSRGPRELEETCEKLRSLARVLVPGRPVDDGPR